MMTGVLTLVGSGALKGLKTGLMLLKVMLPVYIIVVLLKYSPLMPFITDLFEPVMGFLNLPGEAAAPIIAGVFADEYGCIAAMRSFSFNAAAITTIAMVNLFFHSIPVESAINRQIGFAVWQIALFRLFMAVAVGLTVSRLAAVIL
jgi:spore maturation protein SpmB